MDKQALIAAMKASISEVLETMFFLPIDLLADDDPEKDAPAAGDAIVAQLAFTGPSAGCFFLRVPESLTREVSADFLGIDAQQVTQENMLGTVKEMINMLAGNTLSNYDPRLVFDLGIPEITATGNPLGDQTETRGVAHIHAQTLSSRIHMAAVLRD